MTKEVALPPKTKWPDAAPLDGEEMIFSISCGNSHLHWATHFGDAEDYNPQIFWRTPHLQEEDMEHEDLLSILSRNLPDDPHDYIFGQTADVTAADAEIQSKKRTVPLVSVYVVSTNHGQEALLAEIWKTVPSRFFVMRGDDFFSKEEGRYDTMGTDRLATLTGAVHLHGHPALVFDGGTATTYSATDSNGKILGGGIGPGIQSKFRSLTKDTDQLPEITTEEVIARVNEAQEKGNPLPTFARNTQEAMMADAFQEFALKGRNVIEHWLEKADKAPMKTLPKVNSDRRVICTGGDGDLLMQLLQPHYGGVIEHMDRDRAKIKNENGRYVVESSKHLIHYGIADVLTTQVQLRISKEAEASRQDHVGKRVAKHFDVEADDGDNIFRGKVAKAIEAENGEPEFRINYDDGDSEDVSEKELLEMLKLYEVHGEKKARTGKGKKSGPIKKSSVENEAQKENPEKAKSSDEKAVDIPSFPMKKNKSNEAPSDAKKPAAKKAKKAASDIAALVSGADPQSFVRKRIAKDFDGETYFGTIMEYDSSENPPFWHVEYDDGDEEDYNKRDLIKGLKRYQKEGKADTNRNV